MAWEIEYTDEFEAWWNALTRAEQKSVSYSVNLLQVQGPLLSRPHADVIQGSKLANLKELRVQHEGRPYRVLFIFDPRRMALLLLGGDKTGNPRWYEENVPKAEAMYAAHLIQLRSETES